MTTLPPADELHARFNRDGYVMLEDFFAPELMAACDAVNRDHFGLSAAFQHAPNFVAARCEVVSWAPLELGVAPFPALAELPELRAATEAVLGEPADHMASLVMFAPPGSIGQAWHQDCPCDNPSHFNLNRLIYAHDIGDNGGEIVVVPGSHRGGIIPVGEPEGDLPGQVTMAPRAGTLVLLHGLTYHRVLPVKSRPRISINLRVVPHGAPRTITDVGVFRNMRYRFSTREVVEQRQP